MTIQQAIDVAYRAQGFAEHLSAQGLVGRGNEVREAVKSLLTLEETQSFPDFVLVARIEVAEALKALLDEHLYDSGERAKGMIKDADELANNGAQRQSLCDRA